MKIREAKFYKKYKNVVVVAGLPKYLKSKEKKVDIEIMAKLRCGNYEKGNKYWLKGKEKVCKMCKNVRETLEHLVYECEESKNIMKNLLEDENFEFTDLFKEEGNIATIETLKNL